MGQPSPFYCGLSIGMGNEPSALAILERKVVTVADEQRIARREVTFACPWLQRWPLGTNCTSVATAVAELLSKEPLTGCQLVIDVSDCGPPVFTVFKELVKLRRLPAVLSGVIVTGKVAELPPKEDPFHHIGKAILIAGLQVVLGQRRLLFAAGLPDASVLVEELQNYRCRMPGANENFNSRERPSDCLLLALAVSLWRAERFPTVKSFAPGHHGGNYTTFFGSRTLASPGGGVGEEGFVGRARYPWEQQEGTR
jgi:hypothetical protein